MQWHTMVLSFHVFYTVIEARSKVTFSKCYFIICDRQLLLQKWQSILRQNIIYYHAGSVILYKYCQEIIKSFINMPANSAFTVFNLRN